MKSPEAASVISSEVTFMIALVIGACGMLGEAPEHVVLEDSVETLRARFNADSGKVRAILLGSPT